MLVEKLASGSRAVHNLLILIQPLLDGEFLVLKKHGRCAGRLDFVHISSVLTLGKWTLHWYFSLQYLRVSPLLEAFNMELVTTADHLDVFVVCKSLLADRALAFTALR